MTNVNGGRENGCFRRYLLITYTMCNVKQLPVIADSDNRGFEAGLEIYWNYLYCIEAALQLKRIRNSEVWCLDSWMLLQHFMYIYQMLFSQINRSLSNIRLG